VAKAIPEIVSQHAEEAAFLWLLRDAAVRAPHYRLADLARLDNRVEAHLDGLRVNGDSAWNVCKAALEQNQPGEVFAAAVLAFESGQAPRVQEVLKVAAAAPELARAAASALGWLPHERAAPHIRALLAAPSPLLRRIGIAAAAVHRMNPGQPLYAALDDRDPLLRARALRAVGELGQADGSFAVRRNLTAPEEPCRFWAAWSAALLPGQTGAVAVLQAVAEAKSPNRERAVQLALRRLDFSAARKWQAKLAQDPNHLRLAVIGAGVVGDPELVPWLIEHIKVPPLARVAGEGVAMITGVHISYEKLEGEKPEGFEAGPTENPEDENVQMDPDQDLYWPNPNAVANWWKGRQAEFASGTRYLVGKPISPEWLEQVLQKGYQRQRAAAALELALLRPGKPLFEVRAPGFRQQQILREASKPGE
jgi:uncharacterized protein (TIGR02270 family)